MQKNICIVDVELLHVTRSERFIKELCVYKVPNRQLQNYLVLPSVSWYSLKQDIRSLNQYITANIHKIGYNHGQVDQETALLFLINETSGQLVFAKGHDKCRFIASLIGKCVFNLEIFGCPKISDLPASNDCSCIKHTPNFLHCCQIKCLRFGRWFYPVLLSLTNDKYYSGHEPWFTLLTKAAVCPK
jgi:hypothetical protein